MDFKEGAVVQIEGHRNHSKQKIEKDWLGEAKFRTCNGMCQPADFIYYCKELPCSFLSSSEINHWAMPWLSKSSNRTHFKETFLIQLQAWRQLWEAPDGIDAQGATSMNSHKWPSPGSFASGISLIRIRMLSTMTFLYSKPPSSRSTLLKKFMSDLYFCKVMQNVRNGNMRRWLILSERCTQVYWMGHSTTAMALTIPWQNFAVTKHFFKQSQRAKIFLAMASHPVKRFQQTRSRRWIFIGE